MKAGLATAAVLVTLLASAFGGVQVADSRYAPMSEFKDLHWANLRGQIQELRDRIRKAQSPELRRDLELDLDELLALFCRRYPDDRYCKDDEQ